MSNWSYTGDVTALTQWVTSPDAGKFKVTAYPALGTTSSPWVQDFCFQTAKAFATVAKQQGVASTLQVTANDGTMSGGTGTVTMTFVLA